jgi:glycosyltransferase involved in cell wall biosynthesis
MRIAYLLTSLGIGGAERQAIAIAERIARRGHSVLILVLLPPQPEQWPTSLPVEYLHISKSPTGVFCAWMRARRALRVFAPDILHSHTFHANIVARLLRLSGSAPPVISTIHNVYEGGWPRMLAYRLTDPFSLRTTAVSQAAADRFIRLRAVPRRKCTVIPNAIDTREFAPSESLRAQKRRELSAGDDFIWLATGRTTAAKDFPNLIRTFARVWPSQPNMQLWIAGDHSPVPDAEVHAALMTAPHGTIQRVRGLGLRREMPAIFCAADAFVLSSAWEGMPLVVGEAMAAEKPVVCTDVGGVRELVSDAGWMVPPRDPEALSQAMLAVMQLSPAQRDERGRAARLRILAGFDIEARVIEWEAFYADTLARMR